MVASRVEKMVEKRVASRGEKRVVWMAPPMVA